MSTASTDPTFGLVCQLVSRLTRHSQPLEPSQRLIDDLGLDSLKFVDLTVALEANLGIDEFPMQAWLDDLQQQGAPITLGALVEACRALVLRNRPGLASADS